MSSATAQASRALLREVAATLTASEDDYYEINAALKRLGEFCAEVTGFRGRNENGDFGRATSTDHGVALAPDQAAACLHEQLRTRRFLQGVRAGLETARHRFPDRTIEVLYAGCGPYALLLLPFASSFEPGTIRVTLIDIHAESLAAVRKLTAALDLADGEFFTDFIQCDATRYHPANGLRFHLLVSETMNFALIKEPQAAIAAHLSAFLKPGGVMIPEEIRVEAVLVDPARESEILAGRTTRAASIEDQRVLGTVLTLNAETARAMHDAGRIEPPIFRATVPEPIGAHRSLRLRTTIRVFEDILLREKDCSLTQPFPIFDFPATGPYPPISIRYVAGADPHYECDLLRKHPGRIRPARTRNRGRLAHRRLALDFDPERLERDLGLVHADEWLAHHQKRDYDPGTWDVAALRSLDGRKDMIFPAPPPPGTAYAETDLLRRCSYFQEVLKAFACELQSVRLMRLEPGAVIREHTDQGLSIEAGLARLHIPITTEPEVEMRFDDESLELRGGECWYANFELPHSVRHGGRLPRVHLVVDCVANDWLRDLVLGPQAS